MFADSVYSKRIQKLKQKLEPQTLYLFSNPNQITYLTGFQFLVPNEREALFICSTHFATLIHTSFAPLCIFDFMSYLSGTYPSQIQTHIENILQQTHAKKLLYDPATLFVDELSAIIEITNKAKIVTQPMEHNLASLEMMQKDSNEIECITKACQITSLVLEKTKKQLKAGISESDVANYIEEEFRSQGITKLSFPTIVGFGPNSSLPHHQPRDKKLEENMVVLIDLGATYQGYCADMTRTFWFGTKPSTQFKKIESIVIKAHDNAVEILRQHQKKTVLAKDVDNAARVYISNQGFGNNFIHTTGHGLGLAIHESPSLSWKNTDQIGAHMALTIEPGIYLEDNFGYRHENTIVTTNDGLTILTELSSSPNNAGMLYYESSDK